MVIIQIQVGLHGLLKISCPIQGSFKTSLPYLTSLTSIVGWLSSLLNNEWSTQLDQTRSPLVNTPAGVPSNSYTIYNNNILATLRRHKPNKTYYKCIVNLNKIMEYYDMQLQNKNNKKP